jgi:predicted FMN-binding regulatory protein PaiB
MHVFDEFQAPGPDAITALVQASPFAAVVSIGHDDVGDVPITSHLHVSPAPGGNLSGRPTGSAAVVAYGQGQPSVADLRPDRQVLVIFSGPATGG